MIKKAKQRKSLQNAKSGGDNKACHIIGGGGFALCADLEAALSEHTQPNKIQIVFVSWYIRATNFHLCIDMWF